MWILQLPVTIKDCTHILIDHLTKTPTSVSVIFYAGIMVNDAFVTDTDIGIQRKEMSGEDLEEFKTDMVALGRTVDPILGVQFTDKDAISRIWLIDLTKRGLI